jgi:hypothetical protein
VSKWDEYKATHPGAARKAQARKVEMRKSSLAAKTLVRNRDKGEPLRPADPIKCHECCDLPHRRVDALCRPGPCFNCGLPYEEEQIR